MFMIVRFLGHRIHQLLAVWDQGSVIRQTVLGVGEICSVRQILVLAERIVCPLGGGSSS
jgi:hypothetical protein